MQAKNQICLFAKAVTDRSSIGCINLAKLNINFDEYPKYSYEDLIKPADQLPECINNEFKEVRAYIFLIIKYFRVYDNLMMIIILQKIIKLAKLSKQHRNTYKNRHNNN